MHASTLDRRNVNEYIGAAVILNDKAIALLGVEEFNGTCGHQWPPYKNAQTRRCPYKPFRMGLISGFCVFLMRAVTAKATRSGAIANGGHIATLREYCNSSFRPWFIAA
jgi:hypothetical protein